MRRKWKIGIIFLIGFLLCSLPLVNNYIEVKQQESAISTYRNAVKHSPKNNLSKIYKKAKRYNDLLYQTQGSAISNDEILSDDNYNQSLDVSGTGIMGSLEIPKIDVDLPINHGTSDEALSNGVGHIQGTSLPVGGNNTHAVLSGHRGLPSSKLLVRLDEMKKGDYFFIRTCNKTLAYKIYNIKVVEPSDISTLKIEKNKDIVSLVTCTPYGLNTHRLVVTGKGVPYKENVYKSIDEGIPSIREILTNALPLIFLVVFVLLTVPDMIRRRKNS